MMNDFVLKYELLDKKSKKEIDNFLDFLLSKRKSNEPSINLLYKRRILSVSTWNEEDLKIFENNRTLFNNWKIEKW